MACSRIIVNAVNKVFLAQLYIVPYSSVQLIYEISLNTDHSLTVRLVIRYTLKVEENKVIFKLTGKHSKLN